MSDSAGAGSVGLLEILMRHEPLAAEFNNKAAAAAYNPYLDV